MTIWKVISKVDAFSMANPDHLTFICLEIKKMTENEWITLVNETVWDLALAEIIGLCLKDDRINSYDLGDEEALIGI